MQETDDINLLRQYAERGSEPAFTALVARHVNLVYSVALRQSGNAHSAQEITQAVFMILARKARGLSKRTVLSGWLYHTARLTAANFLRTEIRRARREQEAYMQSQLNEPQPDSWPQIAPLLENAMAGLSERDRNAIVLRFFENKKLSEVGRALGASEDAAKRRIHRALEKLRKFLARRGVTLTTAIIAGAVSANSVQAAPAGLTISIAAAAKGSAATAATLALVKGTLKLMAWTKAKTAVAAGVVILLAAGTTTLVVKRAGHQNPASDLIEKIEHANINLPSAQVQAKMLVFSAFAQKRIPDAANWCGTLNADGKLWPPNSPGTVFALNSRMAGRAFSREISGDTVVFFETASSAWNQVGGPELLATNPEGVAVAFADGRALIVPSGEIASLRWTP